MMESIVAQKTEEPIENSELQANEHLRFDSIPQVPEVPDYLKLSNYLLPQSMFIVPSNPG